jgi:hypothetical protein
VIATRCRNSGPQRVAWGSGGRGFKSRRVLAAFRSNPAVPTSSSNDSVDHRSRHFRRINSSINSSGGSISADPDTSRA